MAAKPRRQFYANNETFHDVELLVAQINRLQERLDAIAPANPSASAPATPQGLAHAVTIPAVADPNATAQVFAPGINPNVALTSVAGGSTGYTFNMVRTVETMAVSNAATARAAIGAAQASGFGAGTATLAKLTALGANGSISWNADGCITAYTAPT